MGEGKGQILTIIDSPLLLRRVICEREVIRRRLFKIRLKSKEEMPVARKIKRILIFIIVALRALE
jgi:hypothetical protein